MNIIFLYIIMYPFIVCFCGRSLGDIYDAFKAMRMAKYAEKYADLKEVIDPAILAISGEIQFDLVDVFDQLNIHMDCCRIRLCTQVEFKDLY